jgi:hypothetical protein
MTIKHLYPVIEPSLNLDFANSKKLDPRITFIRGSIGTYVGDDGLIKTAAQDEARFDHDSDGNSLGLLVEESRTNLLPYSEDVTDYALRSVTTPFDSSSVNPTGSLGSYKILSNPGPSAARINKSLNSANNIVVSAFVKKSTHRYVLVGFGGGINSFTALFDIEPGLTSNRLLGQGGNGTFTNIDAGYQNFPNDWIRIWAVGTTSGTDGPTVGLGPDATTFNITTWTAAGTEEIYAWGLQYEDDTSFPTSYIPTEGSTVTRAADVASISGDNFGTFRTNLLQYSEEFDQAAWTKTGSSGSANAITAPNGLVTADKLVEDNSTGSHFARQDVSTTAAVRTASIYLKAGERSLLRIEHVGNTGNAGRRITIDLAAGSITAASTIGSGGLAFADQSIVSVGNGWYRFISTIEPTTTTGDTASLLVFLLDAGGNSSYTGDGTSGIYLWGAQLEESSTATDYIKSDVDFVSRASSATYYDANGVIQTAAIDEARTAAYLPDGNGNFASAGPLLLEDAGTNLLLRSEDFSATNPEQLTFRGAVTADQAIAPNGTLTADSFLETVDTGNHIVQCHAYSYTSGITYTYSVFLRPNGRDTGIRVRAANTTTFAVEAYFDLIGSGSVASVVGGTAEIQNYNNGWYRCILTGVSNATALTGMQVHSSNSVGDVTKGLYIWGAQLEQSSYATSYIPTTTSTATRAADVSTSAATTVVESDWYRQDEGTVFANIFNRAIYSGTNLFPYVAQFDDGTNTERISLDHSVLAGGYRTQYVVRDGNVNQASISAQTGLATSAAKWSAAYGLNSFASASNGAVAVTDSSGTVPTVNRLQIGIGFGAQYNGTISRLTYWPQRLPNATLQALTL